MNQYKSWSLMERNIGIITFKHQKAIFYENGFHFLDNPNPETLAPEIIWFSDLPKNELWLSGLIATHCIKDDMFFNIDFHYLFNKVYDDNVEKTLSNMYQIYHNVLNHYSNIDLSNSIGSFALAIHNNLKRADINSELQEIISNNHQTIVNCLKDKDRIKISKNHELITLRKNPFFNYYEINKNIELPKSDLFAVYDRKLLEGIYKEFEKQNDIFGNSVEKMLEHWTAPFIARITKRILKPVYFKQKDLLSGLEFTHNIKNHIERTWLTSNEYKLLLEYYTFRVDKILVFENAEKIDLKLPFSGLDYFSISKSIVIDNELVAYTLKNRKSQNINLNSAFFAGAIKQQLLPFCIALSNNGYYVHSFGNNYIKLYIKPENKLELIDLANKNGFLI